MNPADLVKRKSKTLNDINAESDWINGKPWMYMQLQELVSNGDLKDIKRVRLKNEELAKVQNEFIKLGSAPDLCSTDIYGPSEESTMFAVVCEHGSYNKKVVPGTCIATMNPNKFRFF